MFPGAGAQVYYNEAGEPLGWDNGGYDDGPDPDDHYDDVESDDDDDDDECGECGGPLASDGVCADDACGADEDGGEDDGSDLPDHDGTGDADQTGEDYDDYHVEPEPQELDNDETSWQYGRDEAYADAEMARYDDDSNPYEGTYSEQ